MGTSVLGAVMSAKVDNLLPVRWAAAHLPTLTAPQLAHVKAAVSVGATPVAAGTPGPVVALVTHVAHTTFIAWPQRWLRGRRYRRSCCRRYRPSRQVRPGD